MKPIKKIIINADDCGKSIDVNQAIKNAILNRKISSTTIMANMDDFCGAVQLYKDFNLEISFGWHINLTEGTPLTQSQMLLDNGFYKENDGHIVFNGKTFRRKFINYIIWQELKKELTAQFEKIRDNGIQISHVDSHHHIHTIPGLWFYLPSFFNDIHIKHCRRIWNYGVSQFSHVIRQCWTIPYKIHGIRMPDTFTSFATYHSDRKLQQGEIIELECHPGHPNVIYKKEMELIYSTNIKSWDAQLISYKDF